MPRPMAVRPPPVDTAGIATIVVALVCGESAVESSECGEGWIVERAPGGDGVVQHRDPLRFFAGMNVVGGELADGPLLLDVGETDFSPVMGWARSSVVRS